MLFRPNDRWVRDFHIPAWPSWTCTFRPPLHCSCFLQVKNPLPQGHFHLLSQQAWIKYGCGLLCSFWGERADYFNNLAQLFLSFKPKEAFLFAGVRHCSSSFKCSTSGFHSWNTADTWKGLSVFHIQSLSPDCLKKMHLISTISGFCVYASESWFKWERVEFTSGNNDRWLFDARFRCWFVFWFPLETRSNSEENLWTRFCRWSSSTAAVRPQRCFLLTHEASDLCGWSIHQQGGVWLANRRRTARANKVVKKLRFFKDRPGWPGVRSDHFNQ